ncbi:hypothetical protein C7D73_28855 [Klebsiella pneumoniae]|nr:hypothetical protein C7D73_28855 [Klebsiella pneumoniae]
MRGFSTSRGHAAAQCVAISHRIPAQGRAQPCGVVAASDRILLSLALLQIVGGDKLIIPFC